MAVLAKSRRQTEARIADTSVFVDWLTVRAGRTLFDSASGVIIYLWPLASFGRRAKDRLDAQKIDQRSGVNLTPANVIDQIGPAFLS